MQSRSQLPVTDTTLDRDAVLDCVGDLSEQSSLGEQSSRVQVLVSWPAWSLHHNQGVQWAVIEQLSGWVSVERTKDELKSFNKQLNTYLSA